MTAQGKTSPEDKGEVARAEVNGNGKPKQITWNGLKLDLPAKLPGTVLRDFAKLEEGKQQLSPLTNLIESILGARQNDAVWDLIGDKGWDIDKTTEALMDDAKGLIPKVTAKYGLTSGESSASRGS